MPFQYDSKPKQALARKAALDKAAGSRKAEGAGGFEQGAARLKPKGDPRRTELYDRGVDNARRVDELLAGGPAEDGDE